LCFCVWFVCCLVVSTSAIDCLERLVPEMTYCVSSGTINTHFTLYDLTLVTLVFFFRRQVQAVYRTYSTSRLLSNPINCRVDYTMSSQRDEDRTHRSSCHFSASSCMCVYVCVCVCLRATHHSVSWMQMLLVSRPRPFVTSCSQIALRLYR